MRSGPVPRFDLDQDFLTPSDFYMREPFCRDFAIFDWEQRLPLIAAWGFKAFYCLSTQLIPRGL
jgi:hypothetical protein